MENQAVLYIYSFPSYLREQPRVKIGRTSGDIDADPTELAWKRIRAQIQTSHPEEPSLLGAIKIPDERVESIVHSQLTDRGYHVSEAPGTEWFRFPNQQELQDFLNKLYRAVIFDDFSELVGGRRDIEGDSFESIVAAFGVRKLSGSEFRCETELVRMLDDELSPLYLNFPRWLDKTMSDPRTVFNVAYRDRQAIGVAIWKPKDRGIAKLSTLYVYQDFRRSGIGRNLLLTCFEQWKLENIRRAFVTTARVELIPFFERYGFWVEGIGREIYERESQKPEWFLTKLLLYEADENTSDAINKAKRLFPSIIGSSYNPDGRREITQIQCNDSTIDLLDSDSNSVNRFSLHSWLNLTYPAESMYAPRIAYVIPIRPRFLIEIFQAGKTVYYGKPNRVQDDMRGALVLFYASRPISGVVAIARIVNRYTGTPAQLYRDLGMRGVLTLEQIGGEGQTRHAVEFDFLMPLRQAISRDDLLRNNILNGTPQSMHSIPVERYKRAVELGGIYAG
jgi:GNAT superfamily N-acetyltransferase